MQIENKLLNAALHVLFVLMAAACVFPLILVISISFSDQTAIAKEGYQIIPSIFSLDAYRYVFTSGTGIGRAYLVTILSTLCGTCISVLVIALYAYPLSRPGLKYKKFFTFFIFFTMLFSGGLVAWYMVVTRILHLSNTIWALVLPLAMNAWYVIIMRTFFQTGIPISLIESAKLDGAGDFTILFRVALPISNAVVAVMVLFYAVEQWNSWFPAFIYLKNRKLWPLQLVLREIIIENNVSDMLTGVDAAEMLAVSESIKYATIVVATLPILCIYPFLQKYFVKGVMIGAVKG